MIGPDLAEGVLLADLVNGRPVLGHVGEEPVVLVKMGTGLFAVGATCTHYGGPLAKGLVVGDTIRCPWHHACFDLRTGQSTAPALEPVPCYVVRCEGQRVVVGGRVQVRDDTLIPDPGSVVIVGAGAAGNATAETLRRLGHSGHITLIGADPAGPVDRPSLSKDFLTGRVPEEWVPLRRPEHYLFQQIDLVLGQRVAALDVPGRRVLLEDGRAIAWDRLVLATGAEPVRLTVRGADLPHVFTLRSLGDARGLLAAAERARRVLIVGASFLGLEVAAALRTRGLAVDVVAPETSLFERVFGPHVGALVKKVHEDHGVTFHLGQTVRAITESAVKLSPHEVLEADLVVVAIGVKPDVALAQAAGAEVDDGILVDGHLQTSLPFVYAVGDVARYIDLHTGKRVRIEHWVHAGRMGEICAENLVGRPRRFDAVPFFWTVHYDLVLSYVGHAPSWDEVDVEGDLAARDCRISYRAGGATLAVLTIGRDKESLLAEAALQRSGS